MFRLEDLDILHSRALTDFNNLGLSIDMTSIMLPVSFP